MAKAQRITKNGRTLYRVQIRRPTKGLSVDEYFPTAKAAERFIRQVEHNAEHGLPVAANVTGRETFSSAVEQYLAEPATTAKGRAMKASASKDRATRMEWLKRECFGDLALRRITWELADAKLSEQAKARGWSAATRYRYECTLSRFFDFCRRNKWIAANPVADQDRLNESDARQRVYTEAEWSALLEKADARKDMLSMFLRLAWETGMRKSELQRLRWVDVSPVTHAALGARIELQDTKNREDRVVFVSKATYALLLEHEHKFRRPSSPRVFPSKRRSGLYTPDTHFREVRTAAGLDQPDEKYAEVLSIHHIRHSWATRLGDSGATLAQLMAAGGWRTAAMAMRYMKRKETQAAEAAALLVGL